MLPQDYLENGAGGGARTRTEVILQGILSPGTDNIRMQISEQSQSVSGRGNVSVFSLLPSAPARNCHKIL